MQIRTVPISKQVVAKVKKRNANKRIPPVYLKRAAKVNNLKKVLTNKLISNIIYKLTDFEVGVVAE